MTPAHVVEITTPKKYILNGLWFGPRNAKTVFIFVHGLSGSMFGQTEKKLSQPLVSKDAAVLVFNNRGHDIISKLYQSAPNTARGYKRTLAGAAHEIFTDCVDDIEGVVTFVEKTGAKRIVLMGHSTGCQKSIYWASKKGSQHKKVRAIILLAPVSDRSAFIKELGAARVVKVEAAARALIQKKKGAILLPPEIWPNEGDAQRVVSLISAASEEEIFSYSQPSKVPKTLQKVMIPTLVFWAERDEYLYGPVQPAANWFEKNMKNPHKIVIVPGVGHSFNGAEKQIAKAIGGFMKER